jgi:hypothetical protein
MANEGGKASREKKRQERQAKRGKGGNDRQRNPIVEEARSRYAEDLRKQGVAADQLRTKVRAHIKDVVKPAVTEAKAGAKSKNLKGPARKKFIQDTVRAKLGMQA